MEYYVVPASAHRIMSIMSTARSFELIDVDDYLQGELNSDVRHEYVAGTVYAMTGGTNAHAKIAMNCAAGLHSQLAGHPCDVFGSDTKIRIPGSARPRFYYPDVSVTCEPNSDSDLFQDKPIVIIEVLSESTRRTDEEEKREAYQSISSLNHYVLLEQTTMAAVVYRRTKTSWEREVVTDCESTIRFPEINSQLTLQQIYNGVRF